jgi:hypothetical protein
MKPSSWRVSGLGAVPHVKAGLTVGWKATEARLAASVLIRSVFQLFPVQTTNLAGSVRYQ